MRPCEVANSIAFGTESSNLAAKQSRNHLVGEKVLLPSLIQLSIFIDLPEFNFRVLNFVETIQFFHR